MKDSEFPKASSFGKDDLIPVLRNKVNHTVNVSDFTRSLEKIIDLSKITVSIDDLASTNLLSALYEIITLAKSKPGPDGEPLTAVDVGCTGLFDFVDYREDDDKLYFYNLKQILIYIHGLLRALPPGFEFRLADEYDITKMMNTTTNTEDN